MINSFFVNPEYNYSNTCCLEINSNKCKIRKYNDTNVCITHFREIITKFVSTFNKYDIKNLVLTKKYIDLCNKNNIPYYKFINILTKYQRQIILNNYKKNEKSLIITNFIKNIVENKYIDKLDDCIICYEKINNSCELASLKCGHHFHKKCIKKYISIKSSNGIGNCPLCRSKIDTFINQRIVFDFLYKFDIQKLLENTELNNEIKNYFVNKQMENDNIYNKIHFRVDFFKYAYESVDIIEELLIYNLYNKIENKEKIIINYITDCINTNIKNNIYYNKNINNGNFVFDVKLVNKIDKNNMYIKTNSGINIASFYEDVKIYHEKICNIDTIKRIIKNNIIDNRNYIPDNEKNIDILYDMLDFNMEYTIDTNNINICNIRMLFKYFDEYIKSNIYYILNSSDNRWKNIKDIIYIDFCEETNKYIFYLNYEKLLKNFILLIKNYYNGKVKSVYDKEREQIMKIQGWIPKRYQTTDVDNRKWFFNITNDNYGIFNDIFYNTSLYTAFNPNVINSNEYNNINFIKNRCTWSFVAEGVKEDANGNKY